MKRDRISRRVFIAALTAMFMVLFTFLSPASYAHAAEQPRLMPQEVPNLAPEIAVINHAADCNACTGDMRLLLYSIRLAEAGPPGCEFGIQNSKAINTNLDIQARWASATIMKNYQRWKDKTVGKVDFITFLGNRYSPPDDNPNWLHNVTFWYDKFGGKPIA